MILLFAAGLALIDALCLIYLFNADKPKFINTSDYSNSGLEVDRFRYPEAEDMYLRLKATSAERFEAEKRAEENKNLNTMLGRENLKAFYYWRLNIKRAAFPLLIVHLLFIAALYIKYHKANQLSPLQDSHQEVKKLRDED